ncbi:MAG: MMPL family transporter [Candidatus Omnitrophica bacterium]|nr:MMPL family transporter [Candidatus Omnitrophota bacterium]MCB9719328.1 MMPL family transporter [Candidatus Omnitrophota bacterium]
MKPNNLSHADRWAAAYARWVVKWRWPVVIVSLVAAALAAYGAKNLTFSQDYRVYFGADNPQLRAYEEINHLYTKNDNVLFVVAPQDGDVFTPATLRAVQEITAEGWKIPYAIRVDSITNYQHSYADGDELIVGDLVDDPDRLAPDDLQRVRAIAVHEPLLVHKAISPEGDVTGVNVTLQFPEKNDDELLESAAAAQAIFDDFAKRYPQIDFYLTGYAMLDNAFAVSSIRDFTTLVPLMYVLMIVTIYLLLRSFTGTFVTLLVMTLSAVIALGLAGWSKVALTPPSANCPTAIMIMAIADSVHILVTMFKEMAAGRAKPEAIAESIRINIQPVIVTSVSTAIGFLTMNFSDVPPFHDVGNITAAGVTAALVLSVLLLPALMAILPVGPRRYLAREKQDFAGIAALIVRRPKRIFWISGALAAALISLIPLNVLEDRYTEYFAKSMHFRQATDFAEQHLAGVYDIHYSIGAGESGGVNNPEYLSHLDDFAAWFRRQPSVRHVSTFSDVMKKLNQNLNADAPDFYRVPDGRELAAQYLLLYEMSLPYGLDLNNQINVDKSATRFVVTLENVSTAELLLIAEQGREWLQTNTPEYMHARASGPSMMFADISSINVRSMLKGSLLGMVAITVLLVLVFRSVKFGLLSMIPNMLPILMGFGVWALINGTVNLGLTTALGMTFGIVVDDTIHFLSKYLRARREQGLTSEEAVGYAFHNVGRALVVTTVILTAGFGLLSLSSFGITSYMSRLTAIVIVLALAADFFLLPSLLVFMEGSTRRAESEDGPLLQTTR